MSNLPDRTRFLHPPEEPLIPQAGSSNGQLLEAADNGLRKTFETPPEPGPRQHLINLETQNSAAIEDEFDRTRINRHRRALSKYLTQAPGRTSLLTLHHSMLAGQSHAQPGQYRTVNVRVGQHRPPAHPLVPSLMDELFTYLSETKDNPLLTAAWAHIQFETIHPFADGNGRTGRAIILHILEAPLPLSVFIYKERQTYYRMLDRGNWDEYLNWFLTGIIQTCEELTRHT